MKKIIKWGWLCVVLLLAAWLILAKNHPASQNIFGGALLPPNMSPADSIDYSTYNRTDIVSTQDVLDIKPMIIGGAKDEAFWYDALAIISIGLNEYYPRPFKENKEESIPAQLDKFLNHRNSPGLPPLAWVADEISGHPQAILIAWAQSVHPTEWDAWAFPLVNRDSLSPELLTGLLYGYSHTTKGALNLATLNAKAANQWPFFNGRLGPIRQPKLQDHAAQQLLYSANYQDYASLTARILSTIILGQTWGRSEESKLALRHALLTQKPYDWGSHLPAVMSLVAFHDPKDPALIRLFQNWLALGSDYAAMPITFSVIYPYLRDAGIPSIGEKMLLACAKNPFASQHDRFAEEVATLIAKQINPDEELLDAAINIAFNPDTAEALPAHLLNTVFAIEQDLQSLFKLVSEAPWRTEPHMAANFIKQFSVYLHAYDPNNDQGLRDSYLTLLDDINTSFPGDNSLQDAVLDSRAQLSK
ncbi:MAG: hypothetical protein HN844_03945 [Planctomycetes bacterium]|nr:hypothetical protein [Planctomycetota bacterium]MBT7318351.1 hypothetical protein [Planctomycetota bacterium]